MKPFPIFRTGKHTASSGATLDFTQDQLRQAVEAYDPGLHEAPIVVGHPKDNHPAYGWIAALTFDEKSGEIAAAPAQIDPAFSEMVSAGRFKKRSASWYLPDAPNNPKPGSLYLRHVGFLGAQPPAVKGLRDVAFNDSEEGVVEYTEDRWAWQSMATIMRNIRDWLIGEKSLEVADRLIPNYFLSDLDNAAKAPEEATESATAGTAPAFSEDDPMKIEELQAQVAARDAEIATLKANQKPADFAEREAALKAREDAVQAAADAAAKTAVEQRVQAAVKAGRVLPAQAAQVVAFAMSLNAADATVEFGEGDKAKKVTQREGYLQQLESMPKAVSYGEIAAGGDMPPSDAKDPEALADKARSIKDKAAAEGRDMTFTEAVARAITETSAE